MTKQHRKNVQIQKDIHTIKWTCTHKGYKKEKQQAANITENDRCHYLKSSYLSNIKSISSRGVVKNSNGNELDSLFHLNYKEGSLAVKNPYTTQMFF